MIYAASKDTLRNLLSWVSLNFQANDMEDLDYDAIIGEVERKS